MRLQSVLVIHAGPSELLARPAWGHQPRAVSSPPHLLSSQPLPLWTRYALAFFGNSLADGFRLNLDTGLGDYPARLGIVLLHGWPQILAQRSSVIGHAGPDSSPVRKSRAKSSGSRVSLRICSQDRLSLSGLALIA